MSLSLERFYQHNAPAYEIELIAGISGLSKEFTWVKVYEDLATAPFLRNNELVISTGMGIKTSPTWLYDSIQSLIDHDCAGLIINIGPYITLDSISPDIIEFCNHRNFPLFVMPWKIHFSDIIQECATELFKEQQRESKLILLIQETLQFRQTKETLLRQLDAHQLIHRPLWTMTLQTQDKSVQFSKNQFQIEAKSLLNTYQIPYLDYWNESMYIIFLFTHNEELIQEFTLTLQNQYKIIIGRLPYIGISNQHGSAHEIIETFKEAQLALAYSRFHDKSITYFDTLGMYRLLFAIHDRPLLESIYKNTLGILMDYDLQHHSELLDTLRVYLLHNSNISDTAKLLFTHRNTINYRINKIKSLLNTDLTSATYRLELLLAFYIKEYLYMIK